jgi:hypothetical protein
MRSCQREVGAWRQFWGLLKSGQVFVRTHVLRNAGFLGYLGAMSGVLNFDLLLFLKLRRIKSNAA